MIRVFLDANIIFSAAYRESSGFTRLWEQADVHLVTSAYALEEAERNITRKRPEASERLQHLAKKIEISAASCFPRENHGLPPKDQPILAAAIGSRSNVLLTGDIADFGHLIGKTIENIRIMTVNMFLTERVKELEDQARSSTP
jgi:predicted nucleic acid-binding protein